MSVLNFPVSDLIPRTLEELGAVTKMVDSNGEELLTVRLTLKEAELLRSISFRTGGDPKKSGRKYMDSIRNKVDVVMARSRGTPLDDPRGITMNLPDMPNQLYLTEDSL